MANIVYGKAGLKIPATIFGKSKFSDGEDDYVRLLINLAYNNPDDNFYIVGKNDFDDMTKSEKEKFFPYGNVFNAYHYNKVKDPNDRYKLPLEYLNENGINVDYGIIGLGAVMSRNIPNMTKTKKGTFAKPLDRGKNYVAPVWHTLNETGVKWVGLVDDPRCMNLSYDLTNKPEILISQIDSEHTYTHIEAYGSDKDIEETVDVVYGYAETTNVLDEDVSYVNDDWIARSSEFSIALNSVNNSEGLDQSITFNKVDNRYGVLKEWVLDKFPDCSVYGKWSDEIINSDSRFLGPVRRSEIWRVMLNWKHSICIPIATGWATTKYLEYLRMGVSPFLHPRYDIQKNINIQDFYRVSTVDELFDKISLSEDVHISEINEAIDRCLSDEYTSGQYLNDLIYGHLGVARNISNKGRKLWRSEQKTALDNFFLDN